MIAAALLGGAGPALAQSRLTPALVTSSNAPVSPTIDAYYRQRADTLVWFRDSASTKAAKLLPRILERAQLDGLADGPDLAQLARAAIERANARRGDSLAEDKLLSTLWVRFVRALKAPVPGMAYGDPLLAPRAPPPEWILDDAARAPSLAAHLRAIAAVNPLYAELRDAAWARMQSHGTLAPDPRVVANLERARVLPASGRFVLVNAATARLWLYEDGKAVDTMKVIVGKPVSPTPMLAGTIRAVTLNPYWNIPTDVARNTVAPRVLQHGTDFLRGARYEAISSWSEDAAVIPPETIDWKAVADGTAVAYLRQLPGPDNMMGAVKLGFANPLGIYLHDTPRKALFTEPKRNFSLGCVRVEDAARLARWVLGREPVAPSAEPEQSVEVAGGVPVYITYLTAYADRGRLAFADDVYGRDPRAGERLADAGLVEVEMATASPRTDAFSPH